MKDILTVLAPSVLATKFVGKTNWQTAIIVGGATYAITVALQKFMAIDNAK